MHAPVRTLAVSVVLALAGILAVAPARTGAATAVRGFDGKTIKIGGLGSFASYPDADVGTRARLARANADHEVRGVTFEVTGYRDDGSSASTASAAATALVDQDRVFAIVPDLSQFTPGDELTRRAVPWFGWGIDASYCTTSTSTSGFGFGYSGCLAPTSGGRVPATGADLFREVSGTTANPAPTVAVVSTATDGGRRMVSASASSLAAAGFDVVFAKGLLAVPPQPYPVAAAEELLQSHAGAPPDSIVCLATTDCLALVQLLRANNYLGTFVSQLYADSPVRGLLFAFATPQYVPFTANTAAQQQLLADLHAVKADAVATPGVVAGYLAADMFVVAVARLRRQGTSITPRHVQQAASRMTFRRAGLYGPVKYPSAFVRSSPACGALVRDMGIAWQQVDAFACTTKTVPLDPRFAQVY
ncbi:MAG: ABC transporter substrate-binding protein [Acidimicrobiia bacterium]